MTKKEITRFNQQNVSCGKSHRKYGFTHFAKKDFHSGEQLIIGWGGLADHQTAHISIQIEKNKFIIPTKWTGRYCNHSCDPNCYIKTNKQGLPELIALKNIQKGEEITFHYAMTEYSWSPQAVEARIPCLCGSKNCAGKILSFSQLPESTQSHFKKMGWISDYLYKM